VYHAFIHPQVAVKKAASKQGKIYVGKFNGPITEEDIRSHFGQFGNVVEIQRPVDRSKNNEPKNFCFVTFDKEEPAETLLKRGQVSINGMEVGIKKVTVKTDNMGQMNQMGGGGRGGGMRGGMRGGRGGGGGGGWGGGWGGGYDQWGGYGGGGCGGGAWGGEGGGGRGGRGGG